MTQQGLFDEPKAHARRRDVETSHSAAASVRNIRESQKYLLMILKTCGPITDELLTSHALRKDWYVWWDKPVKMSPSGIRTRRKELVDLGLVRFSGKWEKMSTGRTARIWEAV